MQTNILSTVARLSDRHLLDETKRLASRERDVTAELVAHLAEIEERGLHKAQGFDSMFKYCRAALQLSEHAAYGRIEAARAARKFPVILEMLAEGSLNLTAVGLVGRHLTRDNCRAVLAEGKGRSKCEVEELVARLHPQPDVPSSIRKLPEAKPVAAPGALLPAAPGSRHIPAEVKRAVWIRDGGRCAFVSAGGRRCGERGFLEYHHVEPYAAGGEATVENISLRCKSHNGHEAELYFGPRDLSQVV